MQTVLPYVLPPLITAASTLVIALLALLTSWVRAHTKSTVLADMVDRATLDLRAIVSELAQQADKMRDATGGLSTENAAAFKLAAIGKFKSMWGEAGIRELIRILGLDSPRFGEWLSAHIEKAVRETPRTLQLASVAETVATQPK